jgi:hypothetical protein
MSHKPLRCAACARRIRASHPNIGIEDYDTGVEFSYHARPECQMRAAEDMERRGMEGKVYLVHHYHVCGDEANGFGCAGGCFDGAAMVTN